MENEYEARAKSGIGEFPPPRERTVIAHTTSRMEKDSYRTRLHLHRYRVTSSCDNSLAFLDAASLISELDPHALSSLPRH